MENKNERRPMGSFVHVVAMALLLLGLSLLFSGLLHTEKSERSTIHRMMAETETRTSLIADLANRNSQGYSDPSRTLDGRNTQPGDSAAMAASQRTCSPNPWLLPPEVDLPYKGLHNNLKELADVQARDIDGYRAISLVFFNYHQSTLMQNAVYSMSKWSGVCNYIVAVWDEPSLEACISMNLPCYNATRHTPGNSTIGASKEAKLHSADYVKITWMKPILVSELLHLDFLVHATDVDIAYAPADLTRSYLKFILDANATAAFQRESKLPFIVNTGNYMVLPNEQGKSFMRTWLERADASIASGDHEQTALGQVYHDNERNTKAFYVCSTPQECTTAAEKASVRSTPVVRRTSNPWFAVYGNTCITKEPHLMFAAHPCSMPHLYFHAVCVVGSAAKIRALKGAGFWFLDDGPDGLGCPADVDNSNVVRCRPLAERIPETEEDFKKCDSSRLVFNYYQKKQPGAAAVDPAIYLSPPPAAVRAPEEASLPPSAVEKQQQQQQHKNESSSSSNKKGEEDDYSVEFNEDTEE